MSLRTIGGVAAIAAGLILGAVEPAAATAHDSPAAPAGRIWLSCGFDGYHDGVPYYTHCGKGDIVIEVDHVFWSTQYECLAPGTQQIEVENNHWAVYWAQYDGRSCSHPGYMVGP